MPRGQGGGDDTPRTISMHEHSLAADAVEVVREIKEEGPVLVVLQRCHQLGGSMHDGFTTSLDTHALQAAEGRAERWRVNARGRRGTSKPAVAAPPRRQWGDGLHSSSCLQGGRHHRGVG